MAVSAPLERNIALYAKTDASLKSPWSLSHWLSDQHVSPVTGLAFARDGRLASSSHDRSAFVWASAGREPGNASQGSAEASQASNATTQRQTENSSPTTLSVGDCLARSKSSFEPQLVITQLRQACLCMSWSPDGVRVALGSSDGAGAVCTHDAARQLWAPQALPAARLAPDVPAGQRSAVLDLCWHPDSTLLAAALSTGRLCVVVGRRGGVERSSDASFGPDENASANVEGLRSRKKGGDAGDEAEPPAALCRAFGDVLWSWQLPARPTSVAWSADGRWLAAACQAPVICFYAVGAEPEERQELAASSLPLRRLCFLKSGALVGGGFDGLPHAFGLDAAGKWREISLRASGAPRREAAASASPTGHDGAIVSIQEVPVAGEREAADALGAFTTAGDDGRVLTWILQRS
ncbi:hypothetical protein H632_c2783p0 [Helicosporidium sp. ATCC 50920]|nr:hypothetical protein H632_c2783p0 [Helicosporidium sp. ATCC 50920]|eukprot:KDD72879.1 hypothetical protein H632_c2783p0 [Helicosporidium sp. ATCC 50920]